jgi:hypothetical protein
MRHHANAAMTGGSPAAASRETPTTMPIASPGQAAGTRPGVEEDRPIGEQRGQHTATALGDDALDGSTIPVRNGTAHWLSRITAATARLAGNVRRPPCARTAQGHRASNRSSTDRSAM